MVTGVTKAFEPVSEAGFVYGRSPAIFASEQHRRRKLADGYSRPAAGIKRQRKRRLREPGPPPVEAARLAICEIELHGSGAWRTAGASKGFVGRRRRRIAGKFRNALFGWNR